MDFAKQHVIPEVEKHREKIKFLRRLKTIEMFADVFMDGTPDIIRSKRDELEKGKHLLEDPANVATCDKLIRAFTSRLYTIPHERYLAKHLAS